MKFTDFKPEELIGKKVLISGDAIRTIKRVTKTAFGCSEEMGGTLYNFSNGRAKGGSAWTWNRAELISDERAAEISAKWAADKLARVQKEEMTSAIKSLTNEQTGLLYDYFKSIKP